MDHTIKLLLKLGSEENILDLLENGTIYMNTIEYFRKVEDAELRGDKYEGVSRIINPTSARLQRVTILMYRTIIVIAVILNLRILPYQPFPYSPILPTPTETRKIKKKKKKKTPFTVSHKILEPKGHTFENRFKTICFLSVFSVLIYIFEEITNAKK